MNQTLKDLVDECEQKFGWLRAQNMLFDAQSLAILEMLTKLWQKIYDDKVEEVKKLTDIINSQKS